MMNRNQTVYLLDSDPSARRGIKHLLGAAGYTVAAFASCGEFLRTESIDQHACLIMDAHTSGLSTINSQTDYLQKISGLSVIIIATDDDKETLKNAHAINAASFFRKPVDGPALLDAIGWALETHEPPST